MALDRETFLSFIPIGALVAGLAGGFGLMARGGPGTHASPGRYEFVLDRPPSACAYKACALPAEGVFHLDLAAARGHAPLSAQAGLCRAHAGNLKEGNWPNSPWPHWGMALLVGVVFGMFSFGAAWLLMEKLGLDPGY